MSAGSFGLFSAVFPALKQGLEPERYSVNNWDVA